MTFPTTLTNAQDRNAVAGTCNTNGTAVARVSGDNFTSITCGFIEIGGSAQQSGTLYAIDSITNANNLVLTTSAGVQNGVYFTAAIEIKAAHLNALEAKIGGDGSAVTSSLDYLIKSAGGWIPAPETWTYASADAPTFTFTISGDQTGEYSPGMRIKLTQTTVKYFIITAVSYSAPNTTVTIYGGTDYTLANAAISSPYYSWAKAPQGFPLQKSKWTERFVNITTCYQTNPTVDTWYNVNSMGIVVPIGSWTLRYKGIFNSFKDAGGSSFICDATLSTSNNSDSDNDLTTGVILITTSTVIQYLCGIVSYPGKSIIVTTKTNYYLLVRSRWSGMDQIGWIGTVDGNLVIEAVCDYL